MIEFLSSFTIRCEMPFNGLRLCVRAGFQSTSVDKYTKRTNVDVCTSARLTQTLVSYSFFLYFAFASLSIYFKNFSSIAPNFLKFDFAFSNDM